MGTVIQTQQTHPGAAPSKAWRADLCDCCGNPGGCGRCLYVSCCPFCAAGDVAQASDGSYFFDCCLAMLVGYPAICWSCTRGRVREKDQINGSCCGDLLTAVFCPCCMLIQELNHLDIRREERAKTQTTVTIVQTAPAPVPQAPQQMAMGYPGAAPAYQQPPMAVGYGGGMPQQPQMYPQMGMMPMQPQQPMGYPAQQYPGMPPQAGYPMGGNYGYK